jgi:hypothetical protein
VTTWSEGAWGAWHTLGAGYDVTARPAAVALSPTEVRLAVNEGDVHLYEPLATFSESPPSFTLGLATATTAPRAAPSLASRGGGVTPYRVLIANTQGRISHRVGPGTWRDIGGIPKPGTGITVVATGAFTFMALINGEEATGCNLSCAANSPWPGGVSIQSGGLWLRHLN